MIIDLLLPLPVTQILRLLQVAVVYVPVLQRAFWTVSVSGGDWRLCAAVGSSVLWRGELRKAVVRARTA
jgi:Ca2+-transporting ATPase